MADFKNMTLEALRELARKTLGPGHSKLRKSELIERLEAAQQKVASAAGKAASAAGAAAAKTATKIKEAGGAAAKATQRVTEKVVDAVRGKTEPSGHGAPAPVRARPAEAAAVVRGRSGLNGKPDEPSKPERPADPPGKAGGTAPDPDAYMVSRVAGEEAVRVAPHPMTASAAEGERASSRPPRRGPPTMPHYEEHLGELPGGYSDDALMVLPRDPKTLFLYWDHAHDTVRRAWENLDGGQAQVWLFARERDGNWTRVRTIDFALESRSYYVHDLEPGRVYRAEIHIVDAHGRQNLLPSKSNEMMLPPVGPSPIIDDRFMRILWSEPLQRLLRQTYAGGPFSHELREQLMRLSDWSRFGGGSWGGSGVGMAGMGEGAGGMGGRPFSPTSSPSASSSGTWPWGGGGEGR
jgi:hypothetical protein